MKCSREKLTKNNLWRENLLFVKSVNNRKIRQREGSAYGPQLKYFVDLCAKHIVKRFRHSNLIKVRLTDEREKWVKEVKRKK